MLVVNSLARQPAIWEITAKADSWPVERARWLVMICGSLEKTLRGKVESWRRARAGFGTRERREAPDMRARRVRKALIREGCVRRVVADEEADKEGGEG